MSILTINGLPVSLDSMRESVAPVRGAVARGPGGYLSKPGGALKRSLDIRSIPMSLGDATALKGLLTGAGHVLSFEESLYSADGLGPDAGYTVSLSTLHKFGSFSCFIYAGRTATWDAQLGDKYVISAWGYDTSWHHLASVSGVEYVDGVASAIVDLTVSSSGAVVLAGSTYSRIDDLVILPYAVPIATLLTLHASAFSALPRLRLAGDFALDFDEAIGTDVILEHIKSGADYKARVSAKLIEA